MTAAQVLIAERQAKAKALEPADKPEGGLDLRHPYNLKALRQIDWRTIDAMRGQQPCLSIADLFLAAVCNPASCPIGWGECQRYDWEYCHYYDLLKTVEAIRHSNPVREEKNSMKEANDGRDW